MISDTPRSKQSIDFRSGRIGQTGRPNSLMKNKTIEDSSSLGIREQHRRYSLVRSYSKAGGGSGGQQQRGSTRNLLNLGGLNHLNFI